MSEHPDYYHDPLSSEHASDDYSVIHPPDDYDYYDEYNFEQGYETDNLPEEDYSEQPADSEPEMPEDLEPEAPSAIIWTRGRMIYALLVTVFVLVLLIYMLVPVIDHFVNPPPPPMLPPAWMA